jgi:AcrR family transcriptional regulator
MSAGERRRQILEASLKVFAEHGFSGARTRDIAESCGINEAILYKHFENKQDLFYCIYDEIHKGIDEVLTDTVRSDQPAGAKLKKIAEVSCGDIVGDREVAAFLIQTISAALNDDKLRDMIGGRIQAEWQYLRKLFVDGIEDSSIAKGIDPGLAATAFFSLGLVKCMCNALCLDRSVMLPDHVEFLNAVLSLLEPHCSGNPVMGNEPEGSGDFFRA